ncbi:cysteine--tRNA ligase [Candidatus Woesearchaeota archaeon]|nr:cysteine--tRNA ligase [Candidatus Woesearchaeota archaeon]
MALSVYNTLTRKKEQFKPIKGRNVKLFVCGVTPYNYAHIGHGKTYIQFDVIVRYLRYRKYKVFYLQNITDIDDKIIGRAKQEGKTLKEVADFYLNSYHEDMQALGNTSVDKYAKATDYIPEIISQVQRLIKKGYAYKISDGYYFDLSKDKDYGKLAGRTSSDAEDAVSRVDENDEKRNKGDFCLWKFYREGDPYWETEFGKGRPGWHIEDTAITEKELGVQYDVHGGARDLIFPHHEAEIAQMESISGKKPLVKYWLHTEFLTIKKTKMSKSLGNIIPIREILKQYDPKVLRYFYLASHYRSPISFDYDALEHARNALQRLNDFMQSVKDGKDTYPASLLTKTKAAFIKAMDDDFDTPKALAIIFDFMREVNKKGGGRKAYNLMKEFDSIFNILTLEGIAITPELKELLQKREAARQKKDFRAADAIRNQIRKKGYLVEDSDNGPVLKKQN